MRKEYIFTEKATPPTAHYSQAVKVGDTVYLAGLCGDDPATGLIVGDGDLTAETEMAMENLKHTIKAAGGTLEDIAKVNVYLTDISKIAQFNAVYEKCFKGTPPARIAMEVSSLQGGATLELDAIAVL